MTMEASQNVTVPRKKIAIRFVYALFFLLLFEIIKIIFQITVVFQYCYLLVTRTYSTPVREFSNKLAVYAYRLMRYATLNENLRPFPFTSFPETMEDPEADVTFS